MEESLIYAAMEKRAEKGRKLPKIPVSNEVNSVCLAFVAGRELSQELTEEFSLGGGVREFFKQSVLSFSVRSNRGKFKLRGSDTC